MKQQTTFYLSSISLIAAIGVSYALSDTVHILISAVLLGILLIFHIKRLLDPIFYFLLPFMAGVYVFGSVFNLFRTFYFFDVIVHFVAAFVITLLVASLLSTTALQKIEKHTWLVVLVISCIGITIGAWWEIFEWFANTYIQSGLIRGPADTVLDLIVDSVGAGIAAGVGSFLFFGKSKAIT